MRAWSMSNSRRGGQLDTGSGTSASSGQETAFAESRKFKNGSQSRTAPDQSSVPTPKSETNSNGVAGDKAFGLGGNHSKRNSGGRQASNSNAQLRINRPLSQCCKRLTRINFPIDDHTIDWCFDVCVSEVGTRILQGRRRLQNAGLGQLSLRLQ